MKKIWIQMLQSQQILNNKPFDLSWAKACLLLDCENQKNNTGGSNNGGRKQEDKKDDLTESIVKIHPFGWFCDLSGLSVPTKQVDIDQIPTVTIDTEGNASPSQESDGNTETDLPDNDVPTEHQVGVLLGCDINDVYIPISTKVFDSIGQDHLFAQDDNNLTVNEEVLALLGMVLSENLINK